MRAALGAFLDDRGGEAGNPLSAYSDVALLAELGRRLDAAASRREAADVLHLDGRADAPAKSVEQLRAAREAPGVKGQSDVPGVGEESQDLE